MAFIIIPTVKVNSNQCKQITTKKVENSGNRQKTVENGTRPKNRRET